MGSITRRDFLKVATGASLAPFLGSLQAVIDPSAQQAGEFPNIIVVLFDAMSASNLSLYGYPRKTCSNLERLAQRSIVYHRHHSAGNFTAPSTASLFTGTYPWNHRVFTLNGLVNPIVRPVNLWNLLPEEYYQAALGQNMYADILLYQFSDQIDRHIGPETASLMGKPFYDRYFPNDAIYGAKIYDQFLFDPKEKPASLFLSLPLDIRRKLSKMKVEGQMLSAYPEGLPFLNGAGASFTIDGLMQSAAELLASLPTPFFAYLHLMPPHAPYRPSREYLGTFDDGWSPKPLKGHRLSTKRSQEHLNSIRQKYDEFIANLDAEFGRLLDGLQNSGLLDNSYLVFTSDHGEFFERGEQGHVTRLLFEAVVQIPLLISMPGQRERQDVYSLTSNVDLLPTLLNIAGQAAPDSCEGRLLPGLGGQESSERNIFTLEAKKNPAYQALKKATVAMWQDQYKLIRYMGYKGFEGYEFYDLENDPKEETNQYGSHPIAKELQAILDKKLDQYL